MHAKIIDKPQDKLNDKLIVVIVSDVYPVDAVYRASVDRLLQHVITVNLLGHSACSAMFWLHLICCRTYIGAVAAAYASQLIYKNLHQTSSQRQATMVSHSCAKVMRERAEQNVDCGNILAIRFLPDRAHRNHP